MYIKAGMNNLPAGTMNITFAFLPFIQFYMHMSLLQ